MILKEGRGPGWWQWPPEDEDDNLRGITNNYSDPIVIIQACRIDMCVTRNNNWNSTLAFYRHYKDHWYYKKGHEAWVTISFSLFEFMFLIFDLILTSNRPIPVFLSTYSVTLSFVQIIFCKIYPKNHLISYHEQSIFVRYFFTVNFCTSYYGGSNVYHTSLFC